MEFDNPKLSLDLRPPWHGGEQKREPRRSSQLRDYVAGLEDELRKIEAFNRELPLSVLLLTDAIRKLKQEAAGNGNFDEISSGASENDEDGDKKSWMSSAQLWGSDQTLSLQLNLAKPRDGDAGQACRYTNKGGASSSFNGATDISPAKEEAGKNEVAFARPGLCLVTSEPAGLNKGGVRGGCSGRPSSGPVVRYPLKLGYQSPPVQLPAMQGQRKQRRCWSPELHRRFVDALERLGGSQVATPKQIRELLQVDGLTNDEVKSHLQKFRLHIRKVPNSMTTSWRDKQCLTRDSQLEGSGGGTSAVADGAASSKVEVNQSGSPQGPLHLTINAAKCDSMEYDDEEKSDSHSWEGE